MRFFKGNSSHPRTDHCPDGYGKHGWVKYVFPNAGLASLIWFLIRVIPKPSRALYPCQRMAFPIASGFVAWILGLGAWGLAFRRARLSLARRRYILALVCAALSVGALWATLSATSQESVLAEPHTANEPIGTPQGVCPGRVVWVHDPDATDWEGPGDGHPWQADHTDPAIVRTMISNAVRELTGAAGDAEAWDAIFKYHNGKRGKGNVGYEPGEKIVIKLNLVGFIFSAGAVDTETGTKRPSLVRMRTRRSWIRSPEEMLRFSGQTVSHRSVLNRSAQALPMTSSFVKPVIFSAARLKEVMRPPASTVKIP